MEEEKDVKITILSLLQSTPSVSTISSISRDYKGFMGQDIPFRKLNYSCLEQFLKSIPDICYVHGSGPHAQVIPRTSEKSGHVNELVTKQKKPPKSSKPNRKMPPAAFQQSRRLRNNDYNYSFTPNNSNSSSSNGWHKPVGNYNPKYNNGNTAPSYNGQKNYEMPTFEGQGQKVNYNKPLVKPQPQDTKPPPNHSYESKNTYKTPTYNKSAQSTTDQHYIQKTPATDVKPAAKPTPAIAANISKRPDPEPSIEKYIENEISIEEDKSNVPERVQNNLKQLIGQFDDGIWANKLPGEYHKIFKKELHFVDYGYSSLIEMCMALKHIFHYVRPGLDDFMLYDRNKPPPTDYNSRCTMSSYTVTSPVKLNASFDFPMISWDDFKRFIPEDVFPLGEEIPNEFFPRDTQVDSVFDVVVIEVYDPSKFWFYLGTNTPDTPLDEMMDELQTFYKNPDNQKQYALPLSCVQAGLYCVQRIFGEYHRAKIVKTYPDDDDNVKLFYIDYATVAKAPTKGLCFLSQQFTKLKAQAIRCRLANIRPIEKGQPWPRETADHFHKLVTKRDTKIKICHFDWDNQFVWVFLADVSDDKKIVYVNELLVKEGMAQWDEETQTQVTPLLNFSNYECKVKNMHFFPTFLELEYGQAPFNLDMSSLEQKFVPVWFSLKNYYKVVDQNRNNLPDKDQRKDLIKSVQRHRNSPIWKIPSKTQEIDAVPEMDFDMFKDLKDEILLMLKEVKNVVVEGNERSDKCTSPCKETLDLSESIMKRLEIIEDEKKTCPLDDSVDFSDESSDAGEISIRIVPRLPTTLPKNTVEDSIFDCEPSTSADSMGHDSGVHKTDGDDANDSEKELHETTSSIEFSETNPFRHFLDKSADEFPVWVSEKVNFQSAASSDLSDNESYKSISTEVIEKISKPIEPAKSALASTFSPTQQGVAFGPTDPSHAANPATLTCTLNPIRQGMAFSPADHVHVKPVRVTSRFSPSFQGVAFRDPAHALYQPWPSTVSLGWNAVSDPRYLLMNRSGNPRLELAPPPGLGGLPRRDPMYQHYGPRPYQQGPNRDFYEAYNQRLLEKVPK